MIETSGHLPECPHTEPDLNPGFLVMCICDRLRTCEARVRDEYIPATGRGWGEYMAYKDGINNGFTAGLSAARDAVEAVGQQHPKWDLMSTHYEDCWGHHSECALALALAAIDGLRGEA